MRGVKKTRPARDPNLPVLLPPRIAPIPPGFKLRDPDDPTPRGDQSIALDEEDELILDKVWAQVARHPRMAADPDAASVDGQARRPQPYRNRQASPKE
jgi:hypothetical protein